jgi:hypothetical protein
MHIITFFKGFAWSVANKPVKLSLSKKIMAKLHLNPSIQAPGHI